MNVDTGRRDIEKGMACEIMLSTIHLFAEWADRSLLAVCQ